MESPAQEPRLDAIRRHLRGSVLDVGCGAGILARDCDDYTGIEPVMEAARIAAATGAEIHNTTAEDFDFAGRQWDVVLFNESLYYTRNPLAVLSKYSWALREGGKLIISIFLRPPSPRRLPYWLTRRMDNLQCAALVERFAAGVVGYLRREDVPIAESYWRIWVIRPSSKYSEAVDTAHRVESKGVMSKIEPRFSGNSGIRLAR
jgi:SAM-dependent methyltransferase